MKREPSDERQAEDSLPQAVVTAIHLKGFKSRGDKCMQDMLSDGYVDPQGSKPQGSEALQYSSKLKEEALWGIPAIAPYIWVS